LLFLANEIEISRNATGCEELAAENAAMVSSVKVTFTGSKYEMIKYKTLDFRV